MAGLGAKIEDEIELPKLTVVLVWVLLDDKHHEQKLLERKGFIHLTAHHRVKSGQDLKAEAWRQEHSRGHRGLCC